MGERYLFQLFVSSFSVNSCEYEVTVWYGICAPAATPKPIVAKINADMVKALNMSDLKQRLYQQGVEASPASPEAFVAFIKPETTKWAKVVKDAGIPSQ